MNPADLVALAEVPPAQWPDIRLKAAAQVEERRRAGTWAGGIRAHTEYQTRPVEWMVEKLGIPEHMIRWSLNPEYEHCRCLRCEQLGNAGQPHIWDGDKDPLVKALELIAQGKSVAVSSGTTTSKTYTLGAAGTLWFLAAFERSTVYSLAPKQDLLLINMWKEIGDRWPNFQQHFPDARLLSGNLRMLNGDGEQELWTARAFGAGVGAEEELAQRLKGFHRARMLWILEEGPGIDQAMIETVIKTASSDFNPILMMGNPAHQHDPLANFGRRDWVTEIRISALDFPNVVADRPIIPGGRSRMSVLRDLADENGQEDSPKYLSQVRGIAPKQAKQALIRWEWLEAAAKRHDDPELRDGPLALGVDPADSPTGDKSAISRWQGACCTEVESFSAKDASEVGRRVFAEIMNPDALIDPRYVGIDSVGIGASTVNELTRLGVRIRRISGSMRAVGGTDVEARPEGTDASENWRGVTDVARYADERAKVFWRLREDLRLNRIALPNDRRLFEELTAIEYEEWPKIRIDKKEKIKTRLGGRSPDKADAVAYGNYVRPRRPILRPAKPTIPERAVIGNRDYGLEMFMAKQQERQTRERQHFQTQLKKLARRPRW